MHAYIYIYICVVVLLSGPSWAILNVIVWAKFVLNTVCQKALQKGVGGFSAFLKNKVAHQTFRWYYLGQVGHLYVATNFAQIITPTWPR